MEPSERDPRLPASAMPTSGDRSEDGHSPGWRLLLVEDDPGDRRLFEVALRSAGFDVDVLVAESLVEAVARVAMEQVDLIVLDLGLPDSEGLVTLDAIQDAAPQVPVIVLTGQDAGLDVGIEAVRAGAQDFLVKGRAEPAELVRAIRYGIERERLSRQVTSHLIERAALTNIEGAARTMTDVAAFLRSAVTAIEDVLPGVGIRIHVDAAEHTVTIPDDTAESDADLVVARTLETTAGPLGWLHATGQRPLAPHQHTFLDRVAAVVADGVEGFVTATALSERTRQLRALHAVAATLQEATDEAALCEGVATALADAFRHPDHTRVQVALDSQTADAGATGSAIVTSIDAPVTVDGNPSGLIRAGYVEDRPWLPEERMVVERAADLVGAWLARRRAEQARHEHAERLARLTETAPVGVTFVDTEGAILYANRGARRIFGVDEDTTFERTFDDPAFRIEAEDGGDFPIEKYPFSRVRATEAPVRDVVHAIHRTDGSRVVISVNATPLFDENGAFDGMVAAITDVTEQRATVRELADSRTWLRLLLGQLPAVVWTVDRDLRFTTVSGAGLRGLDPPPEPGQLLTEYFGSGGDFIPVREHRAAMTGVQRSYAFWWDDEWWQVVLDPLTGPEGNIVGVIGVGLDTTGEKRALEAAQSERSRYRALFEQSSDAIVLTDTDGAIIDANPSACRLTGRERDDLLGLKAVDLAADVHAPDEVGRLRAALLERGDLQGTFFVARPDGTVAETEFSAKADVQPGVNMSILRDVTVSRGAERALAQSEERYRALAEQAVEGIFRIRLVPDRAYEYVNPAFERITGFDRETILATPDLMRSRTHPDDRTGDDAHPVAIRFQRRDGRWRWLELRQTPVTDPDGEQVAVQGIVLDITEEKTREEALAAALTREQAAAEELRRLDELKNGFLQAVSHELRTPLGSMYGFAVSLRDHRERLNHEMTDEFLDRLVVNAERLRELLEDLLDVNRLARGDLAPDRSDVDLADLVRRMTELVPVGHRFVQLDVRPTPASIEASKIERVIHNLLRNAARHTPAGTTIWIRTDRDDDGAHLIVEDDGPGIPAEIREQVFEPFFQGPQAATAAQPGTGIGLSLVRRFTAMHGGRVEATERPGGGTRIHAVFPDG